MYESVNFAPRIGGSLFCEQQNFLRASLNEKVRNFIIDKNDVKVKEGTEIGNCQLNLFEQEPKTPNGPVFLNKNGEIVIQIMAKPGARVNNITDINDNGIGVQISGKPVDGEANTELLKYMTSVLGLKRNELFLDKGSKCKQKTLVVSKKDCTIEYVMAKIKEEMGKNKQNDFHQPNF